MVNFIRNTLYGLYSLKEITNCFKRSVISTRPITVGEIDKKAGLMALIQLSIALSVLSLANDILFKHVGVFSIIGGVASIVVTVLAFSLLEIFIAKSAVINMPTSLLLRLFFLYFAISNIILLITSAGALFESSKVELLILILDTLTNLSILGVMSD